MTCQAQCSLREKNGKDRILVKVLINMQTFFIFYFLIFNFSFVELLILEILFFYPMTCNRIIFLPCPFVENIVSANGN